MFLPTYRGLRVSSSALERQWSRRFARIYATPLGNEHLNGFSLEGRETICQIGDSGIRDMAFPGQPVDSHPNLRGGAPTWTVFPVA